MARTAFRANINPTTPTTYTVPAGKQAIFTAFTRATGADSTTVIIAGVSVITLLAVGTVEASKANPLTADAGEVISAGGAASYTIVGLLFDV